MSLEVVSPDEDLLWDRASGIGAPKATRFNSKVFPVNGEFVAFEIGFQVESARADRARISPDVLAVDMGVSLPSGRECTIAMRARQFSSGLYSLLSGF